MSTSRRTNATPPAAEPQPVQRAKHAILEHYLPQWGKEVLRRSPPAAPTAAATGVHLVYVVAFAASRSVPGSPAGATEEHAASLLGIRALDALSAAGGGRRARANAILLEDDPAKRERLFATLRGAGLEARVRHTCDFESLAPGEIALADADLATAAPELLRYTERERDALYFLDPPTPNLLPLETVHALVRQERTDALIGFPAEDFRKHARFQGIPLADLPSYARRIVDGYSSLFGDTRHEWIYAWRDAERAGGTTAAEQRMAGHYAARLNGLDPRVVSKRVPFTPAAGGAEMLASLFLLTGDPARALQMNHALRAARVRGVVAWCDPASPFVREEETGILDLFASGEGRGAVAGAGGRAWIREVDLPALAHEIALRFAEQAVPFNRILAEFVDTELFAEEVRRAMRMLKQSGRVSYPSLRGDAEVVFGDTRASREPGTGGTRRRRDEQPGLPIHP